MNRRRFIQITAITSTLGITGCLGGGETPTEPEPGDHLENVDNYEQFEDHTGKEQVKVMVGTGEDGWQYSPPAITVDPGTEIVWEWTGKGGEHNVQFPGSTRKSELTDEEGHTYSRTFSDPGTYLYECLPHRGLGMKGAIFVKPESN